MKKRISKVVLPWIAHSTVIWVVINLFTVLPYIIYVKVNGDYLFHEDKSPEGIREYFIHGTFSYDMIILLLFLLLVEINYAYFFTKLRWHLLAVSSLFISIISFTILAFHHKNALTGSLSEVKPILMMTAYAIVYAVFRDYIYQLKHKKELQLQQAQNELNTLKSQLNPHFLFNSLNYLYSTSLKENAAVTANGIEHISDLLRYTITGLHTDFVPLEEEIKFINNYMFLQKVRLPEKEDMVISLQIDASEKGWEIAPMLLLCFIENAFKYGISMNEPSEVDISLNVKNGYLTLKIFNKIIKNHTEIKGNHTGIKSTLKRLELLYPRKHKFEYSTDGTVYRVLLQVQLNKSEKEILLP